MSDLTAVGVLRNFQKQCDFDGVEVQVSRQALDETLDKLESLEKENAALREEVKEWRANYKDWRDSADNGDFDPMKVPTPPTTDKGE